MDSRSRPITTSGEKLHEPATSTGSIPEVSPSVPGKEASASISLASIEALPSTSLPFFFSPPTYSYRTTVNITHTLTCNGMPVKYLSEPARPSAILWSPPPTSVISQDGEGYIKITISPGPIRCASPTAPSYSPTPPEESLVPPVAPLSLTPVTPDGDEIIDLSLLAPLVPPASVMDIFDIPTSMTPVGVGVASSASLPLPVETAEETKFLPIQRKPKFPSLAAPCPIYSEKEFSLPSSFIQDITWFESYEEFKEVCDEAAALSAAPRNILRRLLLSKIAIKPREEKTKNVLTHIKKGVYKCGLTVEEADGCSRNINIEFSCLNSSIKTRVILIDYEAQEKLITLEFYNNHQMEVHLHSCKKVKGLDRAGILKLAEAFRILFRAELFVKSDKQEQKHTLDGVAKSKGNLKRNRAHTSAPEFEESKLNSAVHNEGEDSKFKLRRVNDNAGTSLPVFPPLKVEDTISVSLSEGAGKGKSQETVKGRTAKNPLSCDELAAIVEASREKPLATRLATVFHHAAVAKVPEVVTIRPAEEAVWRDNESKIIKQRKVRAIYREEVRMRTLHLMQEVVGAKKRKKIPLRMSIRSARLFHQQQFIGDPGCFSWIDGQADDTALFFDTNIRSGNESVLRHISRVKNPEIARHLDKVLDLSAEEKTAVGEGKEEKKEEKNSSADEAKDINELHTVHAHKELTGSHLVKTFFATCHPLFSQGITKFIDDSKFTDQKDSFRIPLRVLFPILCNKTYYEKFNPGGVFLIEGDVHTEFNGIINQDSKRRATKLKKLQDYSLLAWHEALQEQARDAKHANDTKLPAQLLDLARKYFPVKMRAATSFVNSGLTIKLLVEAVNETSKKAGGMPTSDLILLSNLLCDGIMIRDPAYLKPPMPGKKINELRECVYELMWNSYVWGVRPGKPLVPAPKPIESVTTPSLSS